MFNFQHSFETLGHLTPKLRYHARACFTGTNTILLVTHCSPFVLIPVHVCYDVSLKQLMCKRQIC